MPALAVEQSADPALAAPSPDPEMVLATALVRAGTIDQDALRRALRVQKKLNPPQHLVPILSSLSYVTEDQVLDVVREAKPRIHLGALLVEIGRLSEHDLRTALSLQEHGLEEGKFGDILVRRHFISERDLVRVVAAQLGVPYVDLEVAEVSMALIVRVPLKLCGAWNFFPLREDDKRMVVAFADPLNQNAVKAARALVGDTLIVAMRRAAPSSTQLAGCVAFTSQPVRAK